MSQLPDGWVVKVCGPVILDAPSEWRVLPHPPIDHPPALLIAGETFHGFAPTVTVSLESIPLGLSLPEWHTSSIEELKQFFVGLRVIDLFADEVDGVPSLLRVCAYAVDDLPLTLMQWLCLRPDGGVVISATCHTANYLDIAETFVRIARSCVVAQGGFDD